jgi:hypothetical protein
LPNFGLLKEIQFEQTAQTKCGSFVTKNSNAPELCLCGKSEVEDTEILFLISQFFNIKKEKLIRVAPT